MLRILPIQDIDSRGDGRPIDQASVTGLAESIAAVGLINPLRVRAVGERWEIVAGAHRLAACKRLDLPEIACLVVDDDDLHAELAMIDENLCRAELSPADRAKQTARRKAIYEELHPEAAAGAIRAAGMNKVLGNNVGANFSPTFTSDTAAATGKSERVVQLDAERGRKVIDEVIDLIRGTAVDTGAYLDKLKKLSPNEQVFAAKRYLADERSKTREASKPKKPKKKQEPTSAVDQRDVQVSRLIDAWNSASADARAMFLGKINASTAVAA